MDRSPVILVVDDQERNVRLLRAMLSPRGFDVRSALSGGEALERIAGDEPDLVLLDVAMPGIDGIEACRRIRADGHRGLPILMITASEGSRLVEALEAGADDFVAKPFEQAEVLARVGSLLRIKRYHDEIAALNADLERRVDEQVAQIERLRRLRRFLAPQVAEHLVESGDESILDSHRRQIAVCEAALRGFRRFEERAEPEEVIEVLGEFHEGAGDLIQRHGATVGSLMGRRLMVFLNDPVERPEPARDALDLALDLRELVERLSERWAGRGVDLDFSAGLAFGFATVGRMGYEDRADYGPIGPVVSLASALCDAAERGELLVDGRLRAEIESDVAGLVLESVEVDGPREPIAASRVSRAPEAPEGREAGELSPREREVLALVAEGLSNRAIAERLVISEYTAIRHVSNIFAKLRVRTRAAATNVAITEGLIEPAARSSAAPPE